MRALADIVLDNPILVKHLRSRLRPAQAVPWAAIVVVMSACIAWVGIDGRWFGVPMAVVFLLGLQIAILTIGGSNQLNVSLGGARESGILAFHRVSPVPPAAIALGFFLGAPIREYLLAAITIPFALYDAYHIDAFNPAKGLVWLAELEVAVLISTWVIHAVAMLGCLTRKKPRGSIQGAIITLLLMLFFGSYGSVGFYYGVQWLLEEQRRMNFFGWMIPWLAWILINELPVLGFLGLAAANKMRAERAHPYSKWQALACMATLSFLTLGGLWKAAQLLPESYPTEPTSADAIMLGAVYSLAFTALVLAATITPGASEYIKGVRRALHEGGRRPSAWSDAGSNRVGVFILAGIVLVAATAVVQVVGRPPFSQPGFNIPKELETAMQSDDAWLQSRQAKLSRPILIGVLTVAYFGLAYQYFSLRTRRAGATLMAVFLFVTWLGPLLAASVLGMGMTGDSKLALTVLALSPLTGVAMSSGLGDLPVADTVQLAALAPAVTFAFLFKYLLVVHQRKIDRALREPERGLAAAAPSEDWKAV
jgi:hypothetical protein